MYQFQLAPVPSVPSNNPRVVEFPVHIGETPNADVAATDRLFTVIEVETQVVLLHIPSLLTKYISELLGLKTGDEPEVT